MKLNAKRKAREKDLRGRAREAAGKIKGDRKMERRGKLERAESSVRGGISKAAQRVRETSRRRHA